MDKVKDPLSVVDRIAKTETRLGAQGRRLGITELGMKHMTDKYHGHGYTEIVYSKYQTRS